MKESVIQERIDNIRTIANQKTSVDDTTTDSVDSTYSASKIEAGFVKKTGDTMTGDLHTSGYFRPDKIWHAYGGFQDETELLAIGSDTWTHITNGDKDLWIGLETNGMSLVSDEMVIENKADYTGILSITFQGGTGKDYLFRIYNVTKAEQMGYHVGSTGKGVGNYTNAAIPIYIEASAGDHIQFQVYCADGTDATFFNAIFYMNYLHD